ncbi:hypothetical protein MANES_08G096500v8 [Manihot esculenta]|uniref:Uncharacterized protein n=1 Tax=Manihot esculenta TaxID=3983 RepID=A0ACB7H9M6_MANES|nr:hypothetical protein MANES_08G096500v8 [Manihot esculenta]
MEESVKLRRDSAMDVFVIDHVSRFLGFDPSVALSILSSIGSSCSASPACLLVSAIKGSFKR